MSVFLNTVERGGNALPHPASLFAIFAFLILVVSAIAAASGLSAIHPATGATIAPVNLFSLAGLHRILANMVTNFTGFAPLGTVLVAMLGIGVMESSGLMSASLRKLVLSAPPRLLTGVLVFAGVMSNMASELGYVLLVPLAGMIFLGAGRDPIAGMAAAFAGVSGGYSANLLLGTVDPLLAGLSEEAARIVRPDYVVNAAANYYFMAVSTPILTLAGTWVTERVVVPRLGPYAGSVKQDALTGLSDTERRALRWALVAPVLFTAVILWGTVPGNGFLRDPQTGDLLRSPFMSGIVAFIFLAGIFIGGAYGFGAGTFKNDADVMSGMGKSISTLGSYLVLVFFAAQFVAFFNWSNLGLIFAVKGADVLRDAALGGAPADSPCQHLVNSEVIFSLPQRRYSCIQHLRIGCAWLQHKILALIMVRDGQNVVRIHGGDAHIRSCDHYRFELVKGGFPPALPGRSPVCGIAAKEDSHFPGWIAVVGIPAIGNGRLIRHIDFVGELLTVNFCIK